MIARALVTVLFLALAVGRARAIDHKNLDAGRPVRVEDAYAIADGEIALEAAAGFTLEREGPGRGVFPMEALYGAYPNLQLAVGTTLSTGPREIDGRPRSGDLRLSALYNFNQETLVLPALALRLGLEVPTGIGSQGVGVEVKGIVTKSIGRIAVHLNAAYQFLTATRRDERDGVYELALGASYPVGAPWLTRLLLVGDVFAEQAARRAEAPIVGTEIGLRYQLTPRFVWDVGVGTEFAGPRRRSDLFMTTGVSIGF
jgi:outer membrane putative beta-barrel porin/alpha-amylase